MVSYTVQLQGGVGFCNAVRRSMLQDLTSWAPFEVVVRKNTSCQTDEFIAHRIGLLNFRKVGEGTEMLLKVNGRIAFARDLVGPAFEPCHPDIEIILLKEGQGLDMTLMFDRQRASKHARYSPCAAVGMAKIDGEGRHRIAFEINDDRTPESVLQDALDALDARVDAALQNLALQPKGGIKSMC